MTVRQLIKELTDLADYLSDGDCENVMDSDVTDVCGNPISRVCYEPDEIKHNYVNVWLDTDYIYDRKKY